MQTASPNIPNHVAIIMDGNGRWAKQRGLPRIEGHRRGVETVRAIIDATRDLGIRYLTLYAFSAENWQRPPDEVSALMGLLEHFLQPRNEGARQEPRPAADHRPHRETAGRTAPGVAARHRGHRHFTDWNLVLALNYGSRTELGDAARAYAAAVAAGREKPEDASWTTFSRYLYTAGMPDPDLLIRTSGETRLSNFLLMQCAYAELIFSPCCGRISPKPSSPRPWRNTSAASAVSASPASSSRPASPTASEP